MTEQVDGTIVCAGAATRLVVVGSQSAPRRPFVPVERARCSDNAGQSRVGCVTVSVVVVAGHALASSLMINSVTCLVVVNIDADITGFVKHGYLCLF